MSNFDGFNQHYQNELTEEIKSLEMAILSGRVTDFPEYRNLVGKRQGMVQALERHKELISLMDNGD